MSKRRQDTSGAFDALVHAIASLGASSRWAGLPPTTTPGSLGRALGQGVIQTRIPQRKATTRTLNAGPVSTSEMAHEGQRSVAELGAILWRAMDGRGDAPELDAHIVARVGDEEGACGWGNHQTNGGRTPDTKHEAPFRPTQQRKTEMHPRCGCARAPTRPKGSRRPRPASPGSG